MQEWITSNWQEGAMVPVSVVAMYLVVMLCIRAAGLRSLAKMSPTDFVWTIALGSLLATAVSSPNPSIIIASIAFASIYALRWLTSQLRAKFNWFRGVAQNDPLLLMDGSEILRENLIAAEVSESDLRSKLREANVKSYEHVLAVTMEPTGVICVLHSDNPDASLDPAMLEGVRRRP